MRTPHTVGEPSRLPLSPIRVFRIEPGKTFHVRGLSHKVYGCNTHWVNGRSFYCCPENCPTSIHSRPSIWKGYIAAEVWDAKPQHWYPVVLEITEHLELDLRGVYAPGQVWEVFRLPESNKKRQPVQGTFLEQRDPHTFPPPFDFVPVLRHVYHVPFLHLDVSNPLPDRLVGNPSAGAGPAHLEAAKPKVATEEEARKVREMAAKLLNGRGVKGGVA